METWREELYHSAKGTHWEKKDHKYKYKKNGRYYYDPKIFGKTQAERSKEASEDYRKAQAEKYANEVDPYKKAPKGILGKIEWALQRLQNGVPIDSKEYTSYYQDGKRVVESVEDRQLKHEEFAKRWEKDKAKDTSMARR